MFGFCKPVSSKKRFSPHRKINDNFSFSLFDKAHEIPKLVWDAVRLNKSGFLDTDYLSLIEKGGFAKLQCRYVILYQNGKACGIIYYQIVDFSAGVFSTLLKEPLLAKQHSILKRYIDSNKSEVLLRLFTCGNNLISGDHGFIFSDTLTESAAHNLLLSITEIIAKEDKIKNIVSSIIIKDFEKPLMPSETFEKNKYTLFSVEPNMCIEIPSTAQSIDEYISLFSKKYRNRAKSVIKSLGTLEVRELDENEIIEQEKEIYNLYEAIFNQAKFKLIKLPAEYFSQTKTIFQSKFTLKGIFLNKQLIAFYSYFKLDDKIIEAHYIGINYELNDEFKLYQNILCELIKAAIENKVIQLNLGRTAAEIKTTVGAKAQDLFCYIKPQNTLSRIIQKPLIRLLQPSKYIARNPFKEET
jgi:hypothetical protein